MYAALGRKWTIPGQVGSQQYFLNQFLYITLAHTYTLIQTHTHKKLDTHVHTGQRTNYSWVTTMGHLNSRKQEIKRNVYGNTRHCP